MFVPDAIERSDLVKQADRIFDGEVINDMGVAIPLVVILTPLPGTQLYKEREHELLTKDSRFYDLLHSVLPTKLPRDVFYKKFTFKSRVYFFFKATLII